MRLRPASVVIITFVSVEIVVALIAVAGSIVSLAWNYRTQRRAAELAEWRAERDP
jgi:hypothetical protein